MGDKRSGRISTSMRLNSSPTDHASFVALTAFILLIVVAIADDLFIRNVIAEYYLPELKSSEEWNEFLAFSQARNFVNGVTFTKTELWVKGAGAAWLSWDAQIRKVSSAVMICLSSVSGFFAA